MTIAEARDYIGLFRRHTLPGADLVKTSSGRKIWLDRMTDEDALWVAGEFQRMEAEAARRPRHRRSIQ